MRPLDSCVRFTWFQFGLVALLIFFLLISFEPEWPTSFDRKNVDFNAEASSPFDSRKITENANFYSIQVAGNFMISKDSLNCELWAASADSKRLQLTFLDSDSQSFVSLILWVKCRRDTAKYPQWIQTIVESGYAWTWLKLWLLEAPHVRIQAAHHTSLIDTPREITLLGSENVILYFYELKVSREALFGLKSLTVFMVTRWQLYTMEYAVDAICNVPQLLSEDGYWHSHVASDNTRNSHVRNLFRCSADYISEGESWKVQEQLYGSNCRQPVTSKKFGNQSEHCFSCTNLAPVHQTDYAYQREAQDDSPELSMKSYWTVLWDLDESDPRAKPCIDMKERELRKDCLMKHLKFSEHYAGLRLGIEVLKTDVLPAMIKNPAAFIVLNYYETYNSEKIQERLIQLLIRFEKEHRVLLRHRVLVIDVHASESSEKLPYQKRFEQAGIMVVQFPKLEQSYLKALDDGSILEDSDGPPAVRRHYYKPLLRVQVQRIWMLAIHKLLNDRVFQCFAEGLHGYMAVSRDLCPIV